MFNTSYIRTWWTITSNSMELSPPWEAAGRSATQEWPNILWREWVRYRLHKNPPLDPTLIQINPVHTTTSNCPRFIVISLSLLHLGLPSGLFPSDFLTKRHVHSSSPHLCYVPCSAHPPRLDHSNYILGRVHVMMLPVIQVSPNSYYEYFILVNLLYQSLSTKPPKRLGDVRNAPRIFILASFTFPLFRPSETVSIPGRNDKGKMPLLRIKPRLSKLHTFTFLTKRNLTMT
jgi:hypothetical protein